MLDQFSRTELILGKESIEILKNAKVAIFGIGGVGTYVAEALARAGVGKFILVDNDVVSITNINRQLIATHKTIGKDKVLVMKERILDINPNATVEDLKIFYTTDTSQTVLDESVDYIVDAIDTVSSKIHLIMKAEELKIPIISCMGTGNKIDPTMLEISDISKTSVCPLAKVMRKELRNRGIKNLKVLYSKEEPKKISLDAMEKYINEENIPKKQVPGSVSFVPSVAGLIIAGEVIKDLIKNKNCNS